MVRDNRGRAPRLRVDPGGRRGAGAILAGAAGLAVLAFAIPGVREGGIGGCSCLASLPLVAFAAYEAVQPFGDAFGEIELAARPRSGRSRSWTPGRR